MFPVKVIHADEDCAVQDCAQIVARTIRLAVHNNQGDVLAFLPGQADIVRCAELLANLPDEGIQVFRFMEIFRPNINVKPLPLLLQDSAKWYWPLPLPKPHLPSRE